MKYFLNENFPTVQPRVLKSCFTFYFELLAARAATASNPKIKCSKEFFQATF